LFSPLSVPPQQHSKAPTVPRVVEQCPATPLPPQVGLRLPLLASSRARTRPFMAPLLLLQDGRHLPLPMVETRMGLRPTPMGLSPTPMVLKLAVLVELWGLIPTLGSL